MVQKVVTFLQNDIWRIRVNTLPKAKAFLIRTVRIVLVSIREFSTDKCSLRASALTFYSLLSIVPVFAMAFGLAKGFGLDKMLRDQIMQNMEGQQEVMTRVMEFSENMLANTKGGVIAGIGLAFLLWTVIKVLGNIERSFNDIWGVKKERTLGRKFSDYLALMLIAPIFFVLASSATVFITTQVSTVTNEVQILSLLGPVITMLLKVLPFAVFWGLLTFLYMFIPNTTINFKSAFIGGIVAGTVYQLVQWVYIHFQIGVGKAGAVYGSFAALPLFLMWLQISWLIVLYGAELAFAHQNENTYEFEPDCLAASESVRNLLALRITQRCVRQFCDGLKPLSAEQLSTELEMPIRLTRDILHRLNQAGILTTIQGEKEKERFFQPGRDVNDLTVKSVLDSLNQAGTQNVPVAESPELDRLRRSLEAFSHALEDLPENVALKNISARVSKEPGIPV